MRSMRRSESERRLVCAAVVLLTLAVPALLAATTIVAKTFGEICREADEIFVGTVAEVSSRWTDRERMEIETLVRFTSVTPIDGVDDGDVTLRFAGGEMEGIREEYAGIPKFEPGHRLVIFARDGKSVSPIVGFRQGWFHVAEGPAGPVIEDVEGRPVTGVKDGELLLGNPEDGVGAALSLESFLEHVRQRRGASR
jgi:hypothetical protein